MSRVSRGSPAGDAYLDLQNHARRSGRPTDEYLHLYVLEGFLARLAISPACGDFVLKGGVLLAAYGTRRPTKDVDLAGIGLSNDLDGVLKRAQVVASVSLPDDGIEFDAASATAEAIRDRDEYAGVRVRLDAVLARARIRFHVDVNVGDPIWPEPRSVEIPRLRGDAPIELVGYPLHMVHAEKIVTAIERGTANTRGETLPTSVHSRAHSQSAAQSFARRSNALPAIVVQRFHRLPRSSTDTRPRHKASGVPGADATPSGTCRSRLPMYSTTS